MSSALFPASLRTPTLAEGLALARRLAERALAERRTSRIESTTPTAWLPSLDALTAVYFQAVTTINGGWRK